MAQFIDPTAVIAPDGTVDNRSLMRLIRMGLSAEEEATHLYEFIADVTDNELVKEVMQDVANEEKVHVGEFQKLLDMFDDDEKWIEEGKQEVEEMNEKKIASKIAREILSSKEGIDALANKVSNSIKGFSPKTVEMEKRGVVDQMLLQGYLKYMGVVFILLLDYKNAARPRYGYAIVLDENKINDAKDDVKLFDDFSGLIRDAKKEIKYIEWEAKTEYELERQYEGY